MGGRAAGTDGGWLAGGFAPGGRGEAAALGGPGFVGPGVLGLGRTIKVGPPANANALPHLGQTHFEPGGSGGALMLAWQAGQVMRSDAELDDTAPTWQKDCPG